CGSGSRSSLATMGGSGANPKVSRIFAFSAATLDELMSNVKEAIAPHLRGKLALGCSLYCSHHSWIAFEQAISQMNDTATVRRATAIVRLTFLTTSALLRPAHPAAPLPTDSPNCF